MTTDIKAALEDFNTLKVKEFPEKGYVMMNGNDSDADSFVENHYYAIRTALKSLESAQPTINKLVSALREISDSGKDEYLIAHNALKDYERDWLKENS